MTHPICGRKVKIVNGGKTQTVNVCSAKNMWKDYDIIVKLEPPYAALEAELDSQDFASLDALITYLQQHHHGQVVHHVLSTADGDGMATPQPNPPSLGSVANAPAETTALRQQAQRANTKILIPATSAEDWRLLLADPQSQWETGYSARTIAYCWQEANGLPEGVSRVFAQSSQAVYKEFELLLAIPEHKVALPGGGHASQSDIWILGRGIGQLVSIAVEGKVSEPFGDFSIGQWLQGASSGKLERLKFLCGKLGIDNPPPAAIRYQLLHRTVSAILEAERFNAANAMMLVHSFSPTDERLDDYQAFLTLFGASGGPGEIVNAGKCSGVNLYFAWVRGEAQYLWV